MAHEIFKKAVKWTVIVLLAHLAAMLLFAMIMAGSVESVAKDSPSGAYRMVLVFDLVFYVIFLILANRFETSYAEYHRSLRNAVKDSGFSMVEHYKKNFLVYTLVKGAVLSAVQIPFLIFYRMFGFSMTVTTVFEQFFILDAGFYGVSGSAVLGFIVATVTLALLCLAVSFAAYAINCHKAKQEVAEFNHS